MTLFELSMAGSGDVWKLLCVVRGYHVYKYVWDPYLEDEFTTKHQRLNHHDQYHPTGGHEGQNGGRPLAKGDIQCCLFIIHGGSITGIAKGRRWKTLEPCGGMEIPCELTFRYSKKILDKLKFCIAQKYQYRAR